jgi:hypothetical protein
MAVGIEVVQVVARDPVPASPAVRKPAVAASHPQSTGGVLHSPRSSGAVKVAPDALGPASSGGFGGRQRDVTPAADQSPPHTHTRPWRWEGDQGGARARRPFNGAAACLGRPIASLDPSQQPDGPGRRRRPLARGTCTANAVWDLGPCGAAEALTGGLALGELDRIVGHVLVFWCAVLLSKGVFRVTPAGRVLGQEARHHGRLVHGGANDGGAPPEGGVRGPAASWPVDTAARAEEAPKVPAGRSGNRAAYQFWAEPFSLRLNSRGHGATGTSCVPSRWVNSRMYPPSPQTGRW